MAVIRSRLWDGIWIWGGLSFGVALIFLPPQACLAIFSIAAVLVTAHEFSSIVLAWTNREFRQHMITRPAKYIGIPAAAISAAIILPLPWIAQIFWVWNIYHFGMQNYGIAKLYYHSADAAFYLGVTIFGMAILPLFRPDQWIAFLAMGIFGFQHWVAAIGLASAASKNAFIFLAAALLVGMIGFLWYDPRADRLSMVATPLVLGLRFGLGFTHFLYDRWVWKLSNPLVRATIGRVLLEERPAWKFGSAQRDLRQ